MSEHIKVLLSEEEVQKRIKELGEQMSRDYANESEGVHLISILNGCVWL